MSAPAPGISKEAERSTATRASLGGRALRPGVLLRVAFVLTFLAYLPSLAFDFVFDDFSQIVMDPWLQSWRSLPLIFTHDVWGYTASHTAANYYRPFFVLWLAIVNHLAGSIPAWYHLGSIFLHLVAGWLVFLLARRLLRDETAAAMAAVVFLLHPGKVEAVVWPSASTELLSAIFTFATVLAYMRARDGERLSGRWLALALVFFVSALLSKETSVLLPAVLLVWELADRDSPWRLRLRRCAIMLASFAVPAVLYMAWRAHVLRGVFEASPRVNIYRSLLTAPLATWWYLRQIVWPVKMSPLYPEIVERHFLSLRVLLPLVTLLALAALVAWGVRRSRMGITMAAWFVVTLAPAVAVVLLVQPHDRYLYLPSFAVCVLVGWALRKIRSAGWQVAVVALLMVLGVVGIVRESRPWRGNLPLFERAVQVAPRHVNARLLLAGALYTEGRFDDSVAQLRTATQIDPKALLPWESLGLSYYDAGDYDLARQYFLRSAATPWPDEDKFVTFLQLGLVAQRQGHPEEAERWLRKAVAAEPGSVGAHGVLADILDKQGKHGEAARERELERQVRAQHGM